MEFQEIIAIIIFLGVMSAIISEKINRSVAALLGAILTILTGIMTFDKSIHYVDFNTLGVLTGMMIFVSVVKKSGLFEYLAIWTTKKTKGDPWKIMMSFIFITAILSAILDNVTTVLLIGPMVIAITKMLDLDPIPFLIVQIMASNIGGTATLIGDPPNIMIGSAANLSFMDFLVNLGPVVVVILFVVTIIFKFMYGKKLKVDSEKMKSIMDLDERKSIRDKSLMVKSIIVIIFVLIGFMTHAQTGIDSSVVALTAGVVMLLISKVDADESYLEIEWTTIFFFAGLFVVVGGLEEVGLIEQLSEMILDLTNGNMMLTMLALLWVSAVVSSFLDNIPFVATLIPLILSMQSKGIDVTSIWWAVSLGACLGGNGSLIGASANLVLVGVGQKNGYSISFTKYLKVGFPIMIVTIIIATGYMILKYS